MSADGTISKTGPRAVGAAKARARAAGVDDGPESDQLKARPANDLNQASCCGQAASQPSDSHESCASTSRRLARGTVRLVAPSRGKWNVVNDQRSPPMPGKRATVKNEKQYEKLKEKGMSKERAARIANSPGASSRGGKKSGSSSSSRSSSRQGGTTAQKKAAGRKGGKAAARKS